MAFHEVLYILIKISKTNIVHLTLQENHEIEINFLDIKIISCNSN